MDVEDENTQTPAIKNISSTQSLPDALTPMKRNTKFSKLEEKSNGDVFWKNRFFQPLTEYRINVKNEEYVITPNIQKSFTDTKLTTKSLNNKEKGTIFDILNHVGLYDMKHTKDLGSASTKDALYNLPKTMTEI